ncbi:hypothetical protein [Methylobacterium phyllosphaerae]|nr:hypothetical protein [Methylobacterium phyllosphaerae]
MDMSACPCCGRTDFGTDEQRLADAGIWAEEFVHMCEHVHERRHLSDLRMHSCPHWARSMQDAAEAQQSLR